MYPKEIISVSRFEEYLIIQELFESFHCWMGRLAAMRYKTVAPPTWRIYSEFSRFPLKFHFHEEEEERPPPAARLTAVTFNSFPSLCVLF